MKGATSLDGIDALRPLSCPLVSVLPAWRIREKQEELEEGDPQAWTDLPIYAPWPLALSRLLEGLIFCFLITEILPILESFELADMLWIEVQVSLEELS